MQHNANTVTIFSPIRKCKHKSLKEALKTRQVISFLMFLYKTACEEYK